MLRPNWWLVGEPELLSWVRNLETFREGGWNSQESFFFCRKVFFLGKQIYCDTPVRFSPPLPPSPDKILWFILFLHRYQLASENVGNWLATIRQLNVPVGALLFEFADLSGYMRKLEEELSGSMSKFDQISCI